MNTIKARQIAAEAAALTELTAKFQSRYGRGYRLAANSPMDARELYHQIVEKQAAIARLLDNEAQANPLERWGNWWEKQDAMSIALAAELAQEVNRLISGTAYSTADPVEDDHSHNVVYTQRAIAGMLHPLARKPS